jgi:transcription elongation factor GreB
LARQLLKKQVGDEVIIERPDQEPLWLEVVAIEYEADERIGMER